MQRVRGMSALETGERPRGTHLSPGVDLANEEVDADVRNTGEKSLALLRILEQPSLGLLERLGPTPFDHVREQGPRCAAKPDERNLAAEPMARASDGGKDVAELFPYVDVLTQTRYVLGRIERRGEGRRGVHEDLHAHRLRDDEDVTKDDRGVDEASVSPYRLERDLARKRGRPADLEKLVLCTDGAELCKFLGGEGWSISQRGGKVAVQDMTCQGGNVLPDASPRPAHARFLRLEDEVRPVDATEDVWATHLLPL